MIYASGGFLSANSLKLIEAQPIATNQLPERISFVKNDIKSVNFPFSIPTTIVSCDQLILVRQHLTNLTTRSDEADRLIFELYTTLRQSSLEKLAEIDEQLGNRDPSDSVDLTIQRNFLIADISASLFAFIASPAISFSAAKAITLFAAGSTVMPLILIGTATILGAAIIASDIYLIGRLGHQAYQLFQLDSPESELASSVVVSISDEKNRIWSALVDKDFYPETNRMISLTKKSVFGSIGVMVNSMQLMSTIDELNRSVKAEEDTETLVRNLAEIRGFIENVVSTEAVFREHFLQTIPESIAALEYLRSSAAYNRCVVPSSVPLSNLKFL